MAPLDVPTDSPTNRSTLSTDDSSMVLSDAPTDSPTDLPTDPPTFIPTTAAPTNKAPTPTPKPTPTPTDFLTSSPMIVAPTKPPTPTKAPTPKPTPTPTDFLTSSPMTVAPTKAPTGKGSKSGGSKSGKNSKGATPTDLHTLSPTTTSTLSPNQVVEEVQAVLDPNTVDALVVGVVTLLESVTAESAIPGFDSIVVITVTSSHLEVATLTQEELDEVKAGLSTILDFGNVATRRYLQAGSGLELIAVGDATIVPCPEDKMDLCVGTASKVMFLTLPITTDSTPTVKSGKGSKSGGSNSGSSKSGGSNSGSSKSGKNSKGTSSPTVPGFTMSPTMKSGEGGKSRMQI
eukprot:scaffold55322_cov68-Attheya_sp.AAC.1